MWFCYEPVETNGNYLIKQILINEKYNRKFLFEAGCRIITSFKRIFIPSNKSAVPVNICCLCQTRIPKRRDERECSNDRWIIAGVDFSFRPQSLAVSYFLRLLRTNINRVITKTLGSLEKHMFECHYCKLDCENMTELNWILWNTTRNSTLNRKKCFEWPLILRLALPFTTTNVVGVHTSNTISVSIFVYAKLSNSIIFKAYFVFHLQNATSWLIIHRFVVYRNAPDVWKLSLQPFLWRGTSVTVARENR